MTFFLDVERSALGRPWRARLDRAGEARALAIAQVSGQSDLMARVLAGRGVALDDVERYLAPTLRDSMPDPFTLRDMEPAVARLALAVQRGEKVAVFGDYDVDGATSAALLAQYLNDCGCETIVHIPDRVTEGYGPNSEAMRAFAAARRAARRHRRLRHRQPSSRSPRRKSWGWTSSCSITTRRRRRCPTRWRWSIPTGRTIFPGLGYLCAAGVVYMGLVALNRALREAGFWNGREAPDLIAALDLAALGAVADVVPLIGLNRALVVKGLSVMRARHRPGLAALLDAAGADGPPRPYHLGFLARDRASTPADASAIPGLACGC